MSDPQTERTQKLCPLSTLSPDEDLSRLTTEQWRQRLPDKLTFEVLRQRATEPPGSGKYLKNKTKGKYVCFGCRVDLFRSEDKIGHGGWPSFRKAMGTTAGGNEADTNIKRIHENYDGEDHTEIQCKKCHSHLGYLYEDAGQPSSRRFCINSVALDFIKDPGEEDPPSSGKSSSPQVKFPTKMKQSVRRRSSFDFGSPTASTASKKSPRGSVADEHKSPTVTHRPSTSK